MTRDRDDDIRYATDVDITADRIENEPSEEVEVAEIRADIEEARVEMGGTLQELGDRLEPGHLMDEAKENVREATIGRVEETARGVSDMVMETVRNNPIPAAMAGAGLALLWLNRSHDGNGHREGHRYDAYYGTTSGYGRRASDYREESGGGIGEKAGEIGEQVSSAVGQVGENVTGTVGQVGQNLGGTMNERVREASWRFERIVDSSPLALGAIAIGAGALVGALLPATRPEQKMLGDASRQVGETVAGTVGKATEKVTEQAQQQLDKAQQSASSGSSGGQSSPSDSGSRSQQPGSSGGGG